MQTIDKKENVPNKGIKSYKNFCKNICICLKYLKEKSIKNFNKFLCFLRKDF